MGLRQLAVYSLPLGLLISGTIAEILGVRVAILVDGLLGVLLVTVCFMVWPDILKARSIRERMES